MHATHHSRFAFSNPLFYLFYNLLFALFFLTGCYSTAPVVKIGLVAPFEGEKRAVGYDVIYSARLAVREANANGGIGGYRVALMALDDMGDPQLARENAAALSVDPDVVAVLGHWDEESTAAAASIYAETAVPFLPMVDRKAEPNLLPQPFVDAYKAVTPFDETPGLYAGPAYEGMQTLFGAIETAAAHGGSVNRSTVAAALAEE